MILMRRGLMAGGLGVMLVHALGTGANAEARLHEVAIRGFKFEPSRLKVRVGDRVRFTNHDLAPHTATAQDGSWDTETLDQNQSAELTISEEWARDYFCAYHPSMTAHLEITA